MGIYIGENYYEDKDLIFSDDPEKNTAIVGALIRESDLNQEYSELEAKYSDWVTSSCCPDYDGSVTREESRKWSERMNEIQEELKTLLDGTGITKEEYEAAKNKRI